MTEKFCFDCGKFVKLPNEKAWEKHVKTAKHKRAWRKRVYGK